MTAPARCLLTGAQPHPTRADAHRALNGRPLSVTRCPCGCSYRLTSPRRARSHRRNRGCR